VRLTIKKFLLKAKWMLVLNFLFHFQSHLKRRIKILIFA
jgi:hypothetical protein